MGDRYLQTGSEVDGGGSRKSIQPVRMSKTKDADSAEAVLGGNSGCCTGPFHYHQQNGLRDCKRL